MGKLPLDTREIILLVALEGMSYEAVAELFDIPIGTVRSRRDSESIFNRDAGRRPPGEVNTAKLVKRLIIPC
jgi:RNA polymerase sigma-70 factor, ECF subfamily